mmetsp:Transcript_77475/g.203387  ORF Transcript_77475/g.203387 Transcript_77475/m.203387 type:complete len:572 (-) Transcript_77475:252-1967(-)
MNQGGDVSLLVRRPEVHLLSIALLFVEPGVGPDVLVRVRVDHGAIDDPNALQGLLVGGGDGPLEDLLPVHGPHARVRGGLLALLEGLPIREVELDLAVVHAQALLQDALRRLPAVLVGRLLRARQLVEVLLLAAVGKLLDLLDQKSLDVVVDDAEAEEHDVYHPDNGLVLRRVEHEPRRAGLHLEDELAEALRLALAEVAGDDAVLLQHLADVVDAGLGGLGVVVAQGRPGARRVEEVLLLGLGLRPPLELRSLLGAGVTHLEARSHQLLERDGHGLRGLLLVGVLQALHQLATALPNSGVRSGLLHLRLPVLVHLLYLGHETLDGRKEGVHEGLIRAEARLLVAVQHALDELFAVLRTPLGDHDLLGLDVFLALEGEAARHEAEHHDADGPDVHLQPVRELEELGGPVRLGAALVAEPRRGAYVGHGAEVAQVDAALRVLDLGPVHEVVVALDVAVDHGVLVQPGDARDHLLADVLDHVDRQHALGLPVGLHALDHIASPVDVHHHAHEYLLVVHVMELHHAGMLQFEEHVCLLLNLDKRRLDLIDHLDRILVLGSLLLARVHDAEGALA